MWKRVGIELGLERQKLSDIEADNPGRNAMAAMDMLSTWSSFKKKVSRRTLYRTIKRCRINKGMYPITKFPYQYNY